MNSSSPVSSSQSGNLDIRDLLGDIQAECLSDYLTLSIRSDGNHTTVSVSTTDIHPETFTAVLHGVAAANLQMLLSETTVNASRDPIV
ncbi:type I secretion C-terminal target domain-containing protein [Methylomicrobium lacus]|uniref:type I secretion C-terminal target domain-containing protein n=1 Tax=Methylomicrobium lacus TaxID=136992 RepID=UPI0035A99699